jgi:hypothetical protein
MYSTEMRNKSNQKPADDLFNGKNGLPGRSECKDWLLGCSPRGGCRGRGRVGGEEVCISSIVEGNEILEAVIIKTGCEEVHHPGGIVLAQILEGRCVAGER